MKYVLYIERGIGEFPHEDVFPLKATALFDALLEADSRYNKCVMYALTIYEMVQSSVEGQIQTEYYLPRLVKWDEQWRKNSDDYSAQNAVCIRRKVEA